MKNIRNTLKKFILLLGCMIGVLNIIIQLQNLSIRSPANRIQSDTLLFI